MFEFLTPGWLHQLIISYGLLVLFVVLTLESIGVPMPGESALIATALFAGSTHQFSILSVVATAAGAAILGDNIGYLIGRRFGLPLLARYGYLVGLNDTRVMIGRYLFQTHGGKIVFFGRFVAFLRTFTALLAGANAMRWDHFFVMNVLGGVGWASLFGFGAYFLGAETHKFAGPAGLVFLALAIVILGVGGLFLRRHEKALAIRARESLEA